MARNSGARRTSVYVGRRTAILTAAPMAPTVGVFGQLPFAVQAILSLEGIDSALDSVPELLVIVSSCSWTNGLTATISPGIIIGFSADGLCARGHTQCVAGAFDRQATIFDICQTALVGDAVRFGRDDALLQPQGAGTRRDRLASDVRRVAGRSEDVDQTDRSVGNVGESAVGPFAEDFIGVRVDRDDPPAVALHHRWDRVSSLLRMHARTNDNDRVVGAQEFLGVRVPHDATVGSSAARRRRGSGLSRSGSR